MRQLVQLNQKAADFKKLNTEVVFVFREERDEVDGLKKIREKRRTKFFLLTDLASQKTAAYSGKRGQYATYILDKKGMVKEILDGTKPKRPGAEPILTILKEMEGVKEPEEKKKPANKAG